MKKQTLFTCIILLIFINLASAQNRRIIGKITDEADDGSLTGVSIQVKNTSMGTLSDLEGKYTIDVPPNSILQFSFVGYTTVEVPVTIEDEINVRLTAIETNLNQVVVVGTRSPGRALLDTPVPVDVVNINQVTLPTARMDLTSILNYAAPSFNYNKQSGSDGADHIDLATLRGLGPDQSLVLINGKRRHQTAFVSVFGTRGRGNSGTDLNALPAAAIDRVEILRDGASAQYGSDAIAGVINLVLKKSVRVLSVNAGVSGYYDKKFNPYFKKEYKQYVHEDAIDGKTLSIDANYGLPIGNTGFINFTLNYVNSGKTYRQGLDTANLFTSKTSLPFNPYRRANGDGSLEMFGGFFNAELPVGSGSTTIYAFGGYNNKMSDAYAFTRNFSARPDRFVTDANGELIEVPGIILTAGDGERYFNPHIQSDITDMSLAAGVRGLMGNGWNWDLSNTVGNNDFHFYGDKTFNASSGLANKNHFDDGGFSFLQNTVNLNFSKQFSSVLSGFNLAAGLEYRYERYNLYAGEEASYTNYDSTGEKATGAQGFPGYQPSDEVTATRSDIGLYIDGELDITTKWLLGAAVRLENYSDFGFTPNFKLSTRYKLTNNFNLRGSLSTGFRAPSLQQINFSSTFTTVQAGVISEVKIAPNDNPITRAAGIEALKQETSLNASVGLTLKAGNNFSFAVDYYHVKIKDRVVLSGQFSVDDNTLNPALITALQDLDVALAQFFANAVNTTNSGVDIVMEYNKRIINSSHKIIFAANFQKMTIDKINVPDRLNDTEDHRNIFLSDREQTFILASAPDLKLSLNYEFTINRFTIGTRLTIFGEQTLLGYGEDGSGIDPMVPTDRDENIYVPDRYVYEGKLVTDLYLGYRFSNNVKLFLGADNLFNVHPSLGVVRVAKYWAYNTEPAGPFDPVQMGGNGTRLFARLAMTF